MVVRKMLQRRSCERGRIKVRERKFIFFMVKLTLVIWFILLMGRIASA